MVICVDYLNLLKILFGILFWLQAVFPSKNKLFLGNIPYFKLYSRFLSQRFWRKFTTLTVAVFFVSSTRLTFRALCTFTRKVPAFPFSRHYGNSPLFSASWDSYPKFLLSQKGTTLNFFKMLQQNGCQKVSKGPSFHVFQHNENSNFSVFVWC